MRGSRMDLAPNVLDTDQLLITRLLVYWLDCAETSRFEDTFRARDAP